MRRVEAPPTDPQPREGWLACPACRAPVASGGATLRCPGCDRSFPVVASIPDLRLEGDRYLDLDTDRARALELDEAARGGASFAELVEHYWSQTPGTPVAIARRHAAGVVRAEAESAAILEALGAPDPGETPEGCLLDVGCGTGGSLAWAARSGRFRDLVGVDRALRWLVVARARLREIERREPAGAAARRVLLIAGSAESLPVRDGVADRVLARHLLEHVDEPARALGALSRALVQGGRLGVEVFHRWAPAPEPHVGLLGVAWLPRRWQPAYVKARTGDPYRAVRLPSRAEVLRGFAAADLGSPEVVAAEATAGQVEGLPAWLRPLVPVHDALARDPRARGLFSHLSPVLRLVATRRAR